MAPMKNPFQVLGLTSVLIKDLRDREISKLVQSQFESLRKHFHPDKAGRSEKKRERNELIFKEINEAYELLDQEKNPRLFEKYKKKLFHQKPFQKQVSELEEQLGIALTRENLLYVRTLDYLKNFTSSENSENGFDFSSGDIYLVDSVAGLYRSDIGLFNDDLFYLLKVDEGGTFTQRRMKKRSSQAITPQYFDKEVKGDKKLIGTISAQLVRDHHKSIKGLLDTFQYTLSSYDTTMTQITGRGSSRVLESEQILFNNQIIPERFKEAMLLMTPRIQPYSYLFSLNKNKEGIYFSLEGEVLGVKKDDQVYQGSLRNNNLFPEDKTGLDK